MPIYHKSCRALFDDYLEEIKPDKTTRIDRKDVHAWFQKNYPKIKKATINCHLLRMSTNAPSRIHYNVNRHGQDDIFSQIDPSTFRLYDPENDPAPIKPNGPSPGPGPEPKPGPEPIEAREFAYERDLRNFLSRNLTIIEPGLQLYEDEESDLNGVEYPAGGRFIDILAVDQNNNFMVVELKVSKGYDRAVGQLLRYMGWVEENLSEEGQTVRGAIIACDITKDLTLATSRLSDVQLFEYELSVTLKKVGM